MNLGILSWILDRERTGIDNYLYNIIQEMINFGKGEDISLFHFKHSDDMLYKKLNDILVPTLPFNFNVPTGLSKALNDNQIDVFHFPSHWPNQIYPFFRNHDVKKVVTIHDIIPILFPENLPYYYRLWAPTLKLIKNNIARIIADSENTKNDCINYLKIPEDKIDVVYLAADKKFHLLKNKELIKEELKDNYGIKYPFILYVGNVEMRKNVSTLIKSFHLIKNQGFKHKLIIIGSGKYGFSKILSLVKRLNLLNEVIFMGYVPDEDLVKFYNTAEVFVFPSYYEGFGLPPLEAMACGCPVISSNSSSLPEIVGDAGILVDPKDYLNLASKISQILTCDGIREDLIERGLKRVKLFSWEKTATETWNVYEDVLEG